MLDVSLHNVLPEVPHCHEELVHIDPACGQGTRRVIDKASTSAIRKVGTRRTRVVRVEHFEEEGHVLHHLGRQRGLVLLVVRLDDHLHPPDVLFDKQPVPLPRHAAITVEAWRGGGCVGMH